MKHGGDLTQAMAEFGGAPDHWLDLSTGINPWPWPIAVNLPNHLWERLPARADEELLLSAARSAYHVPGGVDVIAAAGTQSLIQWLPHLATPGAVAIVGPTYNEHVAAWRAGGHEVGVIGSLSALPDHAKHVVIVNPNNPDGRVATRDELADVAAILQRRGGWLVIDEAFADVDPAISAVDLCATLPVVILRSFGKFYGLAGLRLGFALAAPLIAQRIAAAIGPWACSGPALFIGAAALHDELWASRARVALVAQAIKLDKALSDAGFEIVGGTPLYRLARHADALKWHAALARQQIWCRRFDWSHELLRFGLPPDAVALSRLASALAK
ncbi:L-threonine O-3-phosphate decarboxylase [Bradyrhizobium sp. NFR13]|uniref:threonine-phosphate decarboxylase CobD n=1 Tax=Bradyrhizobium sp. NFR13 TaxID=1566285 RepID=UPI0008EA735A|nr:threonine-phosphate decarboxylase CobD [Bradyrhizobium sp. NFR13]SFM30088.1 L-threonine O-3-phosphate decarboxylase [Bradyrhizobium sp. NFR13]